MNPREAIEDYLQYIRDVRRLSARTVESYGNVLDLFADFLETNHIDDIAEVTPQDVRYWSVQFMDAGASPTSLKLNLSALRSLFRYLRGNGTVQHDVMAKVPIPRVPKPLPVAFRQKEVEKIYDESLFPESFEGVRDRLLLQMLYETGMRRSELCGLTETAVDAGARQIKVTGKRDKERYIPVEPELLHNISAYLALKEQIGDASAALFVTKEGRPLSAAQVYAIVRKYMALFSNAERVSPHVFRHSFATHMLNDGADINAIKELLGHANLRATEIYTHVTREHLKDSYQHAHPRANNKKGG